MIVYVSTDEGGNITGVFARPQISFFVTPIDDADPKVTAFIAANTPAPTLTFLQFVGLFTTAEQVAFMNSTDPQLKLFLLMASSSGGLQLNNPEVVQGVNYAVTQNILTSGRAAQVLAGQPHP